MSAPYRIPALRHRVEIEVVRSRFITTIAPAPTVDEAKGALAAVRAEMPDASHHVYAFRVGFGNSVIEGLSDDGEPSGTSGPPVMAVLRGAGIGDVIVIVTRYFGGTKLGTGGLVRAYSDAARAGLESLATELKIERRLMGFDLPYSLYEQTKRLIAAYDGSIEDEQFEAIVTLIARFPLSQVEAFAAALTELSSGGVVVVEMD